MGPRGGRLGCFGRHMGGLTVRKMGGMVEVFAEQLGLTVDELKEELQAGKTLAEIAEAEGVDLAAISESMKADSIEARKAAIEKAVEDGKMSQAQADWLLQGLEQGFTPMGRGFRRPWGGHFGGFRCPTAP